MAEQQKKIDRWQPDWVALRVLDFARIVHNFGEDTEALANWVKELAEDLLFCNIDTSNEFAKDLLIESADKYYKKSNAGKKGGKSSAKARANKKKSKEAAGYGDAQNESTTDFEESASTAMANDQGDDNTANVESGDSPEPDNHFEARQSQNATEDAAIREDAANNRYAPSGQTRCGTLESGTSSVANFYDQATITETSTDEAREGQTGAGAPSVREKCCHDAPAPHGPRRVKPKAPKNAAEVVAWAADHGIDEVDARDWYELNFVIRPGCDKDGCVIENWPGHCISYCRAVKEKRESA